MAERSFPTPEQLDAMAEEGRRMITARRPNGPDPNSALIWFPPIHAAGLPVPRTAFVAYEPMSLWPICDGQEPLANFPIAKLKETASQMGYPVFIRTDLASAKHDGPKSYRANSEADLPMCLGRTFEDNALKDIADATCCWMFREYLNIGHAFTGFGGLPIGREWRFFADQDGAKCHHFYWPEQAFERGFGVPEDWREQLAILSMEPDAATLETLTAMALKAVQAIGEHCWSVDFAQDEAGKWWLIDMARAESSWHPKHE
jgi:hypothetical protein